ncbi:MAG: nucleoside triphosphate pyrophosphohydrolase [Paludibacteraceae bacterium]|nr:nucleoside triphosphate pyrophosphohydrolase [Paludibacteraceae bacterium]
MHTQEEKLAAFGRLLTIMDELREKCPWDKKQTFESLRQNTIEETYELCSALLKNDMQDICKELGDVLLHIVFYAKIASETEAFDMGDVCNHLSDKLVFRHPHIYGQQATGNRQQASSPEEVAKLWEQVKLKEKDGNKSLLSGIPSALPALIKAYRIQDKVMNAGLDKVSAEKTWQELHALLAQLEQHPDEETMGQALFKLVKLAKLNKIRPDNALEKENERYIARFDTTLPAE